MTTVTATNTPNTPPPPPEEKTFGIRVAKTTSDANSHDVFDFTLTLKKGGVPLTGTYSTIRYTGSEKIENQATLNSAGQLSFQLRNGEIFEVQKIPTDTEYLLEESPNALYEAVITNSSGQLSQDMVVQVQNNRKPETTPPPTPPDVPKTGDRDHPLLYLTCVIIAGIAIICLASRRKRIN